jgi:hypothetical protein
MAEDIESPVAHMFIPLIAKAIREQCQAWKDSGDIEEENIANDQEDQNNGKAMAGVNDDAESVSNNSDQRILIKLDLQVGTTHLKDQFEWPLNNTTKDEDDPNKPGVSPETFAKILASELGVGGEFVPLISHSIREQVHQARTDDDADVEFLQAINATGASSLVRSEVDAEDYEPELRELSDDEIERIYREKERKSRYSLHPSEVTQGMCLLTCAYICF